MSTINPEIETAGNSLGSQQQRQKTLTKVQEITMPNADLISDPEDFVMLNADLVNDPQHLEIPNPNPPYDPEIIQPVAELPQIRVGFFF